MMGALGVSNVSIDLSAVYRGMLGLWKFNELNTYSAFFIMLYVQVDVCEKQINGKSLYSFNT